MQGEGENGEVVRGEGEDEVGLVIVGHTLREGVGGVVSAQCEGGQGGSGWSGWCVGTGAR